MGLTSSRFGSKLTCNPSPCFSPSTATSNTLIKTLKRLRNESTWGERALGKIEKKRLKMGMGMCLGLKTGMYYLRSRAAADAIKFTVNTSMIKDEPKATVDDENTKMVDVGDFLRFKLCVLYTESENSDQPLIHIEVVARVTRPELRSSKA